MSFIVATQSELLKTKRSSAFWLSVISASLIPFVFFLVYYFKVPNLGNDPWQAHFTTSWQILNAFLFPMYIVLICTLIPQIEYKNNTWKQVFSAPQSFGTIYFSKFLTIHLMVFFLYLLFNVLMIFVALLVNALNAKFTFFHHSIDWPALLKLNFKTYVSILGISAIQYWLSLRFKNFIAPMGIGLALVIAALVANGFRWEHIDKIPYAYPVRTLQHLFLPRGANIPKRPFLENHEWNSIGYFVVFTVLAFLDMRFRKAKG